RARAGGRAARGARGPRVRRVGAGRPRAGGVMATPVGVLVAIGGAAEAAVVRAVAQAPGLEVVRRCADLAELLAAAAAGVGRVAVVSADLPGLDREAVWHLHGSEAWVVVLPAEGDPPERSAALGADAVAADGAGV